MIAAAIWNNNAPQQSGAYEKGDWDVDTAVIATRLQKLDAYVQHLRALQQVSIDNCPTMPV